MAETFTAVFFFLSFGQRCCLGKSQTAGAFSQSSFKRGLKLSRFVRLGFCHRVGTRRRSKERIGSRNEFLLDEKVEWNGTNQSKKSLVVGGSPPLGDHLQLLCSACRRLRTEPPLPPWFGFGVDRCPKVAFHIWGPSCVKPEIRILMRSANLEKQLRPKHRGRLYLEMRWVRLAELHSPAFNAQPTFLTAAVFSLLRFVFNAALHLFTWQARLFFLFLFSLPPVSEPSIRHPSPARWVCWVNQTGPVSTAGAKWKGPGWAEEQWLQEVWTAGEGTECEFSQSTEIHIFFKDLYLIFLWRSNPARSALSAPKACRKVSKTRQMSKSGTN